MVEKITYIGKLMTIGHPFNFSRGEFAQSID